MTRLQDIDRALHDAVFAKHGVSVVRDDGLVIRRRPTADLIEIIVQSPRVTSRIVMSGRQLENSLANVLDAISCDIAKAAGQQRGLQLIEWLDANRPIDFFEGMQRGTDAWMQHAERMACRLTEFAERLFKESR